MKNLILVILLILMQSIAPAQSLFKNYTCTDNVVAISDAGDYFWALTQGGLVKYDKATGESNVFTSADGLNASDFQDVKSDKAGNVWVGTWSGLFKFDGKQWQKFMLMDEDGEESGIIRNIFIDSKNRVWVSFGRYVVNYYYNIACYEGNQWKYYSGADGVEKGSFSEFLEDRQGNVWACGYRNDQGISNVIKFEKDNVISWHQNYGLPPGGLAAMSLDSNNNIWVGNSNGVSKYDGTKWTQISFQATVDSNLTDTVNKIMTDRKGNVWFAGYQNIITFDGTNWQAFNRDSGIRLKTKIYNFYADDSNSVWAATDSGVSRYSNGKWENVNIDTSLTHYYDLSLYPDSKGGVLLATKDNARRFDGKIWRTYLVNNSIKSNRIIAMACDKEDNLWAILGTGKYNLFEGLARFDGINWSHIPISDIPGKSLTNLAFDPKGDLWICGDKSGISHFDGTKWGTFSVGDGLDTARCYEAIAFDSTGKIWVASHFLELYMIYQGIKGYMSYQQLYTFDGKVWETIYDIKKDSTLHYSSVVGLIVDKSGIVWALHSDHALYKYDGKKVTLDSVDKEDPALKYLFPSSFEIDKNGDLWIAYKQLYFNGTIYQGGVIRYDGINSTFFSSRDGVPYYNDILGDHCTVNDILIDKTGRKWLATPFGIERYDNNSWMTFNIDNGLAGNYVEAITSDSKGKLWFSCNYLGLSSMYNEYTDVENTTPETDSDNSIRISPNPVQAKAVINYIVPETKQVRIELL